MSELKFKYKTHDVEDPNDWLPCYECPTLIFGGEGYLEPTFEKHPSALCSEPCAELYRKRKLNEKDKI